MSRPSSTPHPHDRDAGCRSCSRSRCQTGDGCSVAVVRASAWNRHRALRRGIASPCANLRSSSGSLPRPLLSGSMRPARRSAAPRALASRPPPRARVRGQRGPRAAVPPVPPARPPSAGAAPTLALQHRIVGQRVRHTPCSQRRYQTGDGRPARQRSSSFQVAMMRHGAGGCLPPMSRAGTAAVPHRQQYELCSAGLRPRAAHRGDGVPRQLNCLPPMSRAGTAAVPHRQQYELCSAGLLLIQHLRHL